MAAHRRTASDVRLELSPSDEDVNPGGTHSDEETDDIDLNDEDDPEAYLTHPLVPNDSYRGKFEIQFQLLCRYLTELCD